MVEYAQIASLMKVLLINPPSSKPHIREGRCMQEKSSWAALWPPLSLAYTAALLRESGFIVKLIDCVANFVSFGKLREIVTDFSPQLVVINSGFPTIDEDLAVVDLVKEIRENTQTALVGMVPTQLEEEVFCLNSKLDFVVVGEPEWAINQLAQALKQSSDLSLVKGLMINTDGKTVKNEPQDYRAQDPNELPFPARDLLDNSKYVLPINGNKFTLLSVGRGCPFQCTFCIARDYYDRVFRKRTPKLVVDEIEECISQYDIRQFLFWGETFTLDRDYAMAISDEIINRSLQIKWATTSRADTVDVAMLEKMRQAGCEMLSLGIESVSDETLAAIKKGCSFEDIKRAIELIGAAGMRRMGHFIFGLPGQRKEECSALIDFALKSGIEYAQFYCAVPYPKTEMGRLAREQGWISEETAWSDYYLSKSIMSNGIMTPTEIKDFRDLAYRKFYLRPKMAWQVMQDVGSLLALARSLGFLRWIND